MNRTPSPTPGGGAARDAYYQRVRPVVGALFAERRLAAFDVGWTGLGTEALLRTGLLRLRVAEEPVPAGSPFSLAFAGTAGTAAATALATLARAHNRFEEGFLIEGVDPARPVEIAEGADLVLGASRAALEAALQAGVPAVILGPWPREAARAGGVLVHLPGGRASADDLRRAAEQMGLPDRSELLPEIGDFDGYLEWLELGDTALLLCRWLLARDPARSDDPTAPGARPDLEARFGRGGACAVLRGQADWPFSVDLLGPSRLAAGGLAQLRSARVPRYRPPEAPGTPRLLVIGCGTASLFLNEAPWLFPSITLLDCKPFSAQNPVRQLAGTEAIGLPKPLALRRLLARRFDTLLPAGDGPEPRLADLPQQLSAAELAELLPPPGWTGDTFYEPAGRLSTWRRADGVSLSATELFLRAADESSIERFERLLDQIQPDVTVVAMGRSRDDNFIACEILRRRGLRHLVPTALPGVSHYKHIVVDGAEGPCYDCLQGHLVIDGGAGPTLSDGERELYYGGTQPATLAETYPSAHSLLRLCRELLLPRPLRSAWFQGQLGRERTCFLGANRVERLAGSSDEKPAWLYGTSEPFQMVTFGIGDIVGSRAGERCSCGRENAAPGSAPAGTAC